MIQDVHSHTYYSNCGRDDPELVVHTAIKGGVQMLGISDHNYGIGPRKQQYFTEMTALQEKFARNEETLEMLEIIRQSLYLDTEYLYNHSLGQTCYMVRDMVATKKFDVASHLAKQEKKILTAIEKTVETMLEMQTNS